MKLLLSLSRMNEWLFLQFTAPEKIERLSDSGKAGEDALGKMVDARTPGLLSLSLAPSEDLAPMPTDDYTLATFYSTWRRSQLKMMHFFGPGVAKVTLSSEGETSDIQIEAGSGSLGRHKMLYTYTSWAYADSSTRHVIRTKKYEGVDGRLVRCYCTRDFSTL